MTFWRNCATSRQKFLSGRFHGVWRSRYVGCYGDASSPYVCLRLFPTVPIVPPHTPKASVPFAIAHTSLRRITTATFSYL